MTFRNECEEKAVEAFILLEKQCDEENIAEIKKMDSSHLNKTRTNQIASAQKRWTKETSSALKTIKANRSKADHKRFKLTSAERTWLNECK